MLNIARTFRVIVLVTTAFLPNSAKRIIYRRIFGYKIHPTARLKICYIDAKHVVLGPESYIGYFTIIRNLPQLILEDYATIGQWNWITCAELFTSNASDVQPSSPEGLVIGRHAALTSRHYVDCPGGVSIGAFTTVAGVRSTILTHQINFAGRQEVKPVTIGAYCYVGANVKFVPGSSVADRCVVGMGAVVAGRLTKSDAVYGGVPARFIRPTEGGEYFQRTVGRTR